jgi:acid stress-induced BolA-like protein IbaG/YrbA
MAMDAAMIERLIKEGLPDAQVTIEDLRGDGDHYAAHVVSAAWETSCMRWRSRPALLKVELNSQEDIT